MRKKIGLDGYLAGILTVLAQDLGRPVDELADEAVRDLLRKHNRPRTLEEAFKQSLRSLPLNDNGGERTKRTR
ncbi:MAG: hypothetical protein AB7E79_15520 [Rhodospirillaceae bacterium]